MTTMEPLDVVAVVALMTWLGYLLGRGLFAVNDKTIRQAERPLDLTGWRR